MQPNPTPGDLEPVAPGFLTNLLSLGLPPLLDPTSTCWGMQNPPPREISQNSLKTSMVASMPPYNRLRTALGLH
ncbi:hypothetical protein PGT21_027126 [Puccinia graminis f. sp. tritici]|uniref:Uncharacterized protein n=1 Tax=Puccinia graminis f. sp. tritici TaxID=56615 RepID=A0A5B0LIV0_PUCGR|nr:hypothetical protein PGTUg99_004088 [Puccinia graminis f. sp. tritici]KAA1086015.1 hypothetical protein PGT21_027126 [Puccinia graminis f. sp. tritici]